MNRYEVTRTEHKTWVTVLDVEATDVMQALHMAQECPTDHLPDEVRFEEPVFKGTVRMAEQGETPEVAEARGIHADLTARFNDWRIAHETRDAHGHVAPTLEIKRVYKDRSGRFEELRAALADGAQADRDIVDALRLELNAQYNTILDAVFKHTFD